MTVQELKDMGFKGGDVAALLDGVEEWSIEPV
jgi:hypothetical protein